MNFEISSYQRVGPWKIGMSPEEVRGAVGVPSKASSKGSSSKDYPSDYFRDIPAFAYYDKNGLASAFEFAGKAHVTFKELKLLETGFSEIISQLRASDPRFEVEVDGFTSVELGIGAYAPSWQENPNEPPQGIIVFAKSYYDT